MEPPSGLRPVRYHPTPTTTKTSRKAKRSTRKELQKLHEDRRKQSAAGFESFQNGAKGVAAELLAKINEAHKEEQKRASALHDAHEDKMQAKVEKQTSSLKEASGDILSSMKGVYQDYQQGLKDSFNDQKKDLLDYASSDEGTPE